ncbi:hypothetical protein H1R20_g13639, partial [Candolleomyces eurysporus]
MLARILSLVALTSSLFLLAAAAPGGPSHGGSNEVTQCDNGTVLCCDQAQDAQALDKSFTALIQDVVWMQTTSRVSLEPTVRLSTLLLVELVVAG